MDDLSPLMIILVKKGGGGDRILFRFPYATKKVVSSVKPVFDSFKRNPYAVTNELLFSTRSSLNPSSSVSASSSSSQTNNKSNTASTTTTTTNNTNNKNKTTKNKPSKNSTNSSGKDDDEEVVSDLSSENLTEFPSNVLSNLFAVNPELCDSKFELKINDVRFVGHPINLEITAEESKYLPPAMRRNGNQQHSSSTIIMFHVVFAIKSTAKYSIVQCFHELSQLVGIAIKSEERRIGYLTSEAKLLSQVQDEVATTVESMESYSPFQLALERSQLARDLKQIFVDVCRTGIVNVKINKCIEVSMCVPHKVHRRRHPTTLVEPEAIFQCLEALRPYHAMVLLYDEKELLDTLPLDASPAMRKVIQHTTPLKNFRTLARDADLSLNQVFQITGHLLYWGKATVIYPLCETNVYVISPYATNIFSNPVLDEEFSDRFPNSEPLKIVLSWFSLPTSLSQRSPPHSLPGHDLARIIVWCLQRNLLLQLHTYVTLAVNPDLTIRLPDPIESKRCSILYKDDRVGVKVSKTLSSNVSPMTSIDSVLTDFTPEEKRVILNVTNVTFEDVKLFARLAKYFRGIYHLEDIMYHENIRRSQLLQVIDKFREILICHDHEDVAVTTYFTQNEAILI